ncbi:MAG: hypothetical protein O6945_04990 [Gammaproteobacteria bacterium]|nr:hypothetical protein [Gammaproteobacteria bacterium]
MDSTRSLEDYSLPILWTKIDKLEAKNEKLSQQIVEAVGTSDYLLEQNKALQAQLDESENVKPAPITHQALQARLDVAERYGGIILEAAKTDNAALQDRLEETHVDYKTQVNALVECHDRIDDMREYIAEVVRVAPELGTRVASLERIASLHVWLKERGTRLLAESGSE